jgi:hypothetical protein
MSEEPQPNKSAQPTPEQLMKLLDLQIAASRAKRKESPKRRSNVAVIGILIIILGIGVALLFLQQMVADLPPAAHGTNATPAAQKSQ